MRSAQESELVTVENAQKSQFLEFSQAWDNYMADYEATAYLSLEKLKEKHLVEIDQLHEKVRKEYKVKLKYTKELMEMKKQVNTLISLKRYEEAEALKQQCNEREEQEKKDMEYEIEEIIEKQEERLRAKQQMALQALLKRIQRDRNEQLKHRQVDSQRLIQRNKNLLLDLLNKQNMETRRTNQFLKYAVGAISPEKKQYFKSKLFTSPEEIKIKVPNNKTSYNNNGNNSSFAMMKSQHYAQLRAKTSKGKFQLNIKYIEVADPRSVSLDQKRQQNISKSNRNQTAGEPNKRNNNKNTGTFQKKRKSQGNDMGSSRNIEDKSKDKKTTVQSDVKLPKIQK